MGDCSSKESIVSKDDSLHQERKNTHTDSKRREREEPFIIPKKGVKSQRI